jgi:hypothetical protein
MRIDHGRRRGDEDEHKARAGIVDLIERHADHRFFRSELFGELH